MRLVFAGTPEFAREAMAALHAAGHEIVLVLTQPDRPAGRGMKLQASPVKQLALAHGIPVAQPRSLRLDGKYPEDAAAAQAAIAAAQADAMVVAAYGLILPQWVLDAMAQPGAQAQGRRGLGCLNIHASVLPRWRGAAPIHRAIETGDAETGITIMQMDEGLDTGDMLLVGREPIAAGDTTGLLHDRLAALGGRMIVDALQQLAGGQLQRVPQPVEGVTYAAKIAKDEAALDFRLPADTLLRRIRAFNPFPGASAQLGDVTLKLWNAELASQSGAPGTVLDAGASGVTVACGEGALRFTELQKPGGKRLPAAVFLQGFPLQEGQQFRLNP